MKRALVFLLIALTATVLVVVFNQEGKGPNGDGAESRPGNGKGITGQEQPNGEGKRQPLPNGKTDEERVRYRILDLDTRKPIAGARIVLIRDGSVVAATDTSGFADVAKHGLLQLAFVAKDHLADTWVNRRAEAREITDQYDSQGYLKILLRADGYTVPFAFRFIGPENKVPEDLRFVVRCLDEQPPGGRSFPTNSLIGEITPELRAAWLRHYQLCFLKGEALAGLRTHLGTDSHVQTFEPDGGSDGEPDGATTLRFVATGFYEVEARSKDGLFASQSFEVRDRQSRPLTVHLKPGRFFRGSVVSAKTGKAIASATVLLHDEGKVVDMSTSDAAGKFQIGPLADRAMGLEVQHGNFETKKLTDTRPGKGEIVLRMTPLSLQEFHGWVRQRGTRKAVAGATIELEVDRNITGSVKTDVDGKFAAKAPDKVFTIRIRAPGHLPYSERIGKGAPPSSFEVLPVRAETRVAARLTAIIDGVVLRDGKPAAGVVVQLVPTQNPGFAALTGPDGRSIFEGWQIKVRNTAITKKDGTFRLEWPHPGTVRIRAMQGLGDPGDGVTVQLVPGHHRKGLQMQIGR